MAKMFEFEAYEEVRQQMIRYLARSGYGRYYSPSNKEIELSEGTYRKMGFYALFEEYVSEVKRDATES